MRNLLPAALLAASALYAQDVAGDWQGTLKAGGAELRVVFHIIKASDGKLSGTFDSLDQGARGIPIEEITLADGKLRFSSAAVNGTYEGKLNPAASTIDGKWSQGQPSFPQGGNDIPLLLPVKDAAAIRCRRQPAV